MYPDQPQLNNAPFGGNPEDQKTATARAKSVDNETERANDSVTKSYVKKARAGQVSDTKDHRAKLDENYREARSANLVHNPNNMTVRDLEAAEKMGYPSEISGDAIARAKKGQTPKLHRS